jgi:preprotein translocase subunit SecE
MSKAIASIKDYFAGAMSEMKKVVWPTKKQTIRYSIAVILMSLFVAFFFGILDFAFSELLGILISV